MRFLFLLLFTFICNVGYATTWYVRDGGGTATQCTGTTNATYPGSGTGVACAFNHPSWALGSSNAGQGNVNGVMAASDTLDIVGVSDLAYNFTVSGMSTGPKEGDTYTTGGQTYTVMTPAVFGASSGSIEMKGVLGTTPASSGTLTRTSGSGDTTISYSAISVGQAQFMIGYGMPNGGTYCTSTSTYAYACDMLAIPAGTSSSSPSIVKGIGSQRPQLWGTQGAWNVINASSGNTTVQNLELTDHSPCSYNGADPSGSVDGVSPACTTTDNPYPYGTYGKHGLEINGANLTTSNNFIHRTAEGSIVIDGTVSNWNSSNDTVVGSGGGDALISNNSTSMAYTGNNSLSYDRWAWGGCSEYYPDINSNVLDYHNYHHCADQTAGGNNLGGGFMNQNTASTCGSWTISNSMFYYNIKTNIDFLHCSSIGTFNFYRSRSEGSTGESLKLGGSGSTSEVLNVEESQIIANPPNWDQAPLSGLWTPNDINGSPISLSSWLYCRGDASILLTSTTGTQFNFINSDISGNCSALIVINAAVNSCAGTAINTYNTKLIGAECWHVSGGDQGHLVDIFYNGGSDGNGGGNCGTGVIPFNQQNDSCNNVRSSSTPNCSSGTNTVSSDPKVVGENTLGAFTNWLGPVGYYNGTILGDLFQLQSSSPLITAGSTSGVTYTNGTTKDFNGFTATSPITIGSYQGQNSCAVNGWFACYQNSDCCNSGTCTSSTCVSQGPAQEECGISGHATIKGIISLS